MITLAHEDQLLHLQFNSTVFPEAFLYFTKQVMTRFADRVPIWITMNKPNNNFYNYADNHNILMGHAKIDYFYIEELKRTGKISTRFANRIALPLTLLTPPTLELPFAIKASF